jgi:YbbR domain-containing protein
MVRTKNKILRSAFFKRKNLLVFAVCMLISALLWVLMAFNSFYTKEIFAPIRYINLPENKILPDKLPSEAEIEITGSGYQLFSYRLRPKQAEVLIDGRNIGFKGEKGFISTFHAIDYFNRQHGDVIALNVKPDKVFLQFIDRGFKKVPVVVHSFLDFAPAFNLRDSLVIRPDSIQITGSIEEIARIDRVETHSLIAQELNKSATYLLKLKEPTSEVVYSPSEVAVIAVRFTKARIAVPVKDSRGRTTEPRIATLAFQVAFSHYNKIKASDFEITLDTTLTTNGKHRLLVSRAPLLCEEDYLFAIRCEAYSLTCAQC